MDKAHVDASESQMAGHQEHLRELAEVTAEYATYSGKAYGLAAVAAGIWVGIGLASRQSSLPLSGILLILAPLGWLAALVAARRYYQRFGVVVLKPPAGIAQAKRTFIILVLTLLSAIQAIRVVRVPVESDLLGMDREVWLIALATCLVATPLLASVVTRTVADAFFTVWVVLMAWKSATLGGSVGSHDLHDAMYETIRWLSFVFLVLGGVLDHVRYRKVERRLLALRERK